MPPPHRLTEEAIDDLVDKMEALVPRLAASKRKSVVAAFAAELNMLQPFAAARDAMMASLSDSHDKDRQRLQAVFGGDCVRITRIRATTEAALSTDRFTEGGVLMQCFKACESVEMVLRDLGLGWKLAKAQKEQKVNLSRRLSQVGVLVPEEIMSPEALAELRAAAAESAQADEDDSEDDEDDSVSAAKAPQGSGAPCLPSAHALASKEAQIDPLRMLAEKKKAQAKPVSAPSEGGQKLQSVDDFLQSQLPLRRPGLDPSELSPDDTKPAERNPSKLKGFLRVTIMSAQDIDSVTWYHLKFVEDGEDRFYQKRYRDFKELDKALRDAAVTRRAKPLALPDLPESGILGLRHTLDIGHFNERRLEGLRQYIQAVVAQVTSLSDEPALEAFFSRDAAVHIILDKSDGDSFTMDK